MQPEDGFQAKLACPEHVDYLREKPCRPGGADAQIGGRFRVAEFLDAVCKQGRERPFQNQFPAIYFGKVGDDLGNVFLFLADQPFEPCQQFIVGELFEVDGLPFSNGVRTQYGYD